MKRCLCMIPYVFCLLTVIACGKQPAESGSPSSAAGDAAQVRLAPNVSLLEQSLKNTSVVLQMPSGVFETDLWEMGMRVDPNGNRYYDPTLLSAFCTGICRDSAVLPTDAAAVYQGGKDAFVYTEETSGLVVQPQVMSDLLQGMPYTADAYSIAMPSEPIAADVTAQGLMQARQLIGSYTTSFRQSPLNNKNRVFNITKAAEMIDGKTVLSGETFSMNQTIGDRNKQNGWKTATAITGGKYTKEYGGGVCQVSSTLFNAVLMANLEIVERYHHSWPMTYVPIGRDATISTGSKDFIFRNNTGSDIVVSAQVNADEKTVNVSLYGVPPKDYAYIELESERTGSVAGKGEKRILDESLPNGTRVVERKARTGKRSVTYQCFYDPNGMLIERRKAFEDTYPSIQGIVYLSSDLYY